MDNNAVELMFSLIRSVVNGTQLTDEEKKLCSLELLTELYTLSKKHDLAHLVAVGLQTNQLLSPSSEYFGKFYSEISSAIVNHQKQKYEFEKLCKFFNDRKIPFIPLKGAVIRELYPQPWMRTSSDIDILIPESKLEECIEEYSKITDFSEPMTKDGHHVAVTTANGVHVEFHYDLVESDYANNAGSVLAEIWDCATPKNENEFLYEVSQEMFLLYHFAHMAKHFQVGGCGVRPLIDTYLISKTSLIGETVKSEYFSRSRLDKFAHHIIELSSVWFAGKEHTDSTKRIEAYILSGGVFGTIKNQLFLQQNRIGGKQEYVKSRIIMPYESLKMLYPVLEKHRLLFPIMQVRRWFKIVFKGRFRYSVKMLKQASSVTNEESDTVSQMIKDLGL